MKPYFVNFAFGLALIILSVAGYFFSATPSSTAFIPAAFGLVLISMTSGMKKENKVVAHIVVTLTLLVLIALAMPLRGAIQREDSGAILRIIVMMAAGVLAMAVYIKSFVDARRNRPK